jgi:hypothetical protein
LGETVSPEEYQEPSVFGARLVGYQYVAFVDLLGFGARIQRDFDSALQMYNFIFSDEVINLREIFADVTVRVMSDAFILSASRLASLVRAVNILHFKTLFNDSLIRGGIGKGKHIEFAVEGSTYLVSQLQAVAIEKTIRYPCIALHENVTIPPEWWAPDVDVFLRPLLFFEGVRLVNPFNIMWGFSAMTRVARMRRESPEHYEKFDWFLRLYDAVKSRKPLLPPVAISSAE